MKALLTCNITTVPPTVEPKTLISILKLDDIDPTGEIIAPRNASPYFQFLCWFLTCVFGVKVKSKKQKIASLTRKYLSLIDKELTDLFGFTINITEKTKNLLKSPTDTPTGSPTSSATDSPSCRGMDKVQIPLYYLYLAYDSFVAPMAYDKYDDYAKNHPKKDDYPSEIKRIGVSCDVVLYDGGIAIDPYTPVMDFILTDLSGRFEKLPVGISKIIAVSEKMRGVLLNFLSSYQNPASVQKYLCSLSEDSFADILYVPGSHDARKFFELTREERTPWLRYLIYKIRISENVIDDVTDKPNPKDRFFCIKLLFLLIKYLILPDISPDRPCGKILTVELLFGLPFGLPTPEELNIPFLIEKINNYYDKCRQIERQQKVNALNADRKGITLSAVCALPKKKSDASKVSEKFVEKFKSAIDEAEATVEKETKVVKPSSTKKLRPSVEPASSEPVKSSLTPEQQAIDAAIETEAAAGVVSQLLQNLLVPKQKRTKKSKEDAIATTAATATTVATDTSAATGTTAKDVKTTAKDVNTLKGRRRTPKLNADSSVLAAASSASPAQIGAPVQSALFAESPQPFVASTFGAPSPFGTSAPAFGAFGTSAQPAQFGAPEQPAPFGASAPAFGAFGTSAPAFGAFRSSAAALVPLKSKTITISYDDAIYTGEVDTKGEPSGYGEMVYYTDSTKTTIEKTYKGTFKQGERDGSGVTTYLTDPEKKSYQGTYRDGIQNDGLLTYKNGTNVQIKDGKRISSPVSNTAPQPPTPLPEQQNVKAKQVFKKASLADQQEGDKKTKLGATKREKPEEPEKYSVNLRDVNTKGSKRREIAQGGSPTFSIHTPSKTRKSHQRKRSHSSNKSTFKRRKYIAE